MTSCESLWIEKLSDRNGVIHDWDGWVRARHEVSTAVIAIARGNSSRTIRMISMPR
jgi:hypothetical protein